MPLKNILLATVLAATTCGAATAQAPIINHIALHVSQLSRSTVFYQLVLGLDTIPEPFRDGKHTWLSLGAGVQLHLIEAPPAPVMPLKHTHFCLSVPSVKAFADKLQKMKVAWEDWPGTPGAITTRKDGVQQLYLRDPDGYWIEVNDDYPKR